MARRELFAPRRLLIRQKRMILWTSRFHVACTIESRQRELLRMSRHQANTGENKLRAMKSWRIFNGLVLLLAVALTLRDQALWKDFSITSLFELPFWLWVVSLSVWTVRLLSSHKEWRPKTPLVPLSLAMVIVCGMTHLPLRVLFWTHKSALRRALSRPPLAHRSPSKAPQIGILRPIDIAKAGRSTRFLFREDSFFAYGWAVGFADCPNDAGCSRTSFPDFFVERNGKPETIQMNADWVAIKVSGS